MARTLTNLECKDPWLYWWLSLPVKEQIVLLKKHFPHRRRFDPSKAERKQIWALEQAGPMKEEQWLDLAEIALENAYFPAPIFRTEIWRQIYRIACQRT